MYCVQELHASFLYHALRHGLYMLPAQVCTACMPAMQILPFGLTRLPAFPSPAPKCRPEGLTVRVFAAHTMLHLLVEATGLIG